MLRARGAQVTLAAWNVTEDQPKIRDAELVVIRRSRD
jgi:hypothetical protein